MTKRSPEISPDFFGGEEALDRLVGSRRGAELINARIEDIDPNPYNPRQLVDVSELVDSLKEHGFMGRSTGGWWATGCSLPTVRDGCGRPNWRVSAIFRSISIPSGTRICC